LKKCNSKIRYLGAFDIKDTNVQDDSENDYTNILPKDLEQNSLDTLDFKDLSTYKELNESQTKKVIDYLFYLNNVFNLYDLEYDILENEFIESELSKMNDSKKKHMKQISSIVSQVNAVIDDLVTESSSSVTQSSKCCLVELGAGRGKLSLWFDSAWKNRLEKINDTEKGQIQPITNILLIERGSQRLKVDTLLKTDMEERNAEFQRLRLDLKDLYINKVDLIEKSDRFILYGKHLCGVATDYSLRCLKKSLENGQVKFKGILLAVCCHHKCEYESFCGKKFLNQLKIDSKLFYIIRSISSWSTCGDRNSDPAANVESIFGHERHKIGKICKNLFDYARIQYLKNIELPEYYTLKAKIFYYVDREITLENTMIYASLEKKMGF
jgi:tRNA:m4X modification enzyme